MNADQVISALTTGAELRTWSLIVTIFGDMARAPGAEIPGPVLTALTARMGVKPEAVRVALHRLRKDGWIASRRAGRVSHYFLTEAGRAESEAATARIFARHPDTPQSWHVAIGQPRDPATRLEQDARMAAAGCIPLGPDAWLGRGPAPDGLSADFFVLDGTAPRLPDWLRDRMMPTEIRDGYAAFEAQLASLAALLDGGPAALAPLDIGAIRILVVHRWRRLVLRHPDLPDGFFPADWPGARVRAQVHDLLDRLGAASCAELAEAALA